MRDHNLKNAVGELEDWVQRLANEIGEISVRASHEGAEGHSEFYEHVQGDLTAAVGHLTDAYTWLLNGAEELGVEPLEDE